MRVDINIYGFFMVAAIKKQRHLLFRPQHLKVKTIRLPCRYINVFIRNRITVNIVINGSSAIKIKENDKIQCTIQEDKNEMQNSKKCSLKYFLVRETDTE